MASEDTFDDVKEALLDVSGSFEIIQNLNPLEGLTFAINIGHKEPGRTIR